MPDILFKAESYKIIGACMEVHKKLGSGFLESVYSEALEIEFTKLNIAYEREKKLLIFYEEKPLNKYFRADFVCFNSIILELKATKFKLGLLINFGSPSLTYKRIVN